MATVSPPSSSPTPPPGENVPPPARGRRPLPPNAGRALAIGALAVVVLIVAFLAFGGGGGANYHLEMKEAGQLVKGDQVQVGGVPVGSVTNIELTPDYKARITIHVESSLTPLHEGTVSEIRVPSLTGVANRYVALTPGPNNRPALASGATLPASETHEVVDLDQLFNTLDPKTRKGLQQFIQGSAEQYVGTNPQFGKATEYFAPSFAAIDHFFSELVRDQGTFTDFLVESAKALTTLGARRESLSGLVEHANQTFQAIGSQQQNLAQGLRQLPVTLHQGNQAFTEIPATLSALTRYIEAQKPSIPALTTLFQRLRPLVTTATPAVTDFSQAISRPGSNNDLTEAFAALPALVGQLTTASPAGVQALRESVPETAPFGPYAPEFQGLFRDFGQTGAYYDANGHYAHISPVFPSFALGANNTLTPSSAQQALEALKTGQLRRCPGAATQPSADGSAPFADNGVLSCDPTETP
ncbi:MAG TPA: MlaD family protein [Solirubrobacteraceae bacterium]|nr:MlaD family protein [Solirubrobacteraceae bacterium]